MFVVVSLIALVRARGGASRVCPRHLELNSPTTHFNFLFSLLRLILPKNLQQPICREINDDRFKS